MDQNQQLEEIKIEIIEQLKTINVLPDILNNLEKTHSNYALIQFIQNFCKHMSKKHFNCSENSPNYLKLHKIKKNFKCYLKIIIKNVWEQKIENYIKNYKKEEEIKNKEDFHIINNEPKKNIQIKNFEYKKSDFHERQNNKFQKNILNWKQQQLEE